MSSDATVAELVESITARRWIAIRKALDATLEEITEDPISLMVVACNEKHRAEHGNDSWDRYLDMKLSELTEELGLSEDGTKSDES